MTKVTIDGHRYIKAPPKPKNESSLLNALEVRFDHSELGDDITVRHYLQQLLSAVWEKVEGFNGKRPWGESDWDYDIFVPLALAGFVDLGPKSSYKDGDETITEFASPTRKQIDLAHAYVHDLILAMCYGVSQ